jgi:2-phospho-L-lactate guanylyltransferase
MSNQRKKIKKYLQELPPSLLVVPDTDSVEILDMLPGSYNLNFRVRVHQKEFIFRINIEPQSGLPNQIEYEFRVLKFLQNQRIAPQAYHFDDSRICFDYGLLIEEYLEGPYLTLEKKDVWNVVDLLTKLHSLKPGGMQFVIWKDPLADTYALAHNDLMYYESRAIANMKTIRLAKKLLANSEAVVHNHGHLYHPDSLNHTDVTCDNFIKTAEGLRLIDWEKPRVDDSSYDICCFLSEPVQMWFSRKILRSEDRVSFLHEYARLSGKSADQLMEKVKIREPLISLHWILWGATKIVDLKDRKTSPELLAAHEEKMARYERIADPKNIEKLMDSALF